MARRDYISRGHGGAKDPRRLSPGHRDRNPQHDGGSRRRDPALWSHALCLYLSLQVWTVLGHLQMHPGPRSGKGL
ncbi:hypothetical protein [Frog virus 3]